MSRVVEDIGKTEESDSSYSPHGNLRFFDPLAYVSTVTGPLDNG